MANLDTSLLASHKEEIREMANQFTHIKNLLQFSQETLKEMEEKWESVMSSFQQKFDTELRQLMKSKRNFHEFSIILSI